MPESDKVDTQENASLRASGRRGPAIVAWSVCAVGIGALVVGAILEESTGNTDPSESLFERFALLVGFGALPAIGALVASRHPRNAVGWLFVAVGFGIGVLLLSAEYAHWALVENAGHYPLATAAAWLEQWLWLPSVGLTPTLILLLFPDGRPPSPRWKWLVWASAVALSIVAIGGMIEQRLQNGYSIDNPIGVPGIEDVESEPMFAPFLVLFIPLAVMCAVSLVVRFRRSRGAGRQQLKLMTFSACLMVAAIAVGDALRIPGTLAVALLVFATSLAVSMLKYRLYDIDRVINKTIVYGVLTALLLAGYATGVLLIQTVLPLPDNSRAAVAGSTLAMAALFRPLRRRIQSVVDRRFYRLRYDAAHAVESFGARLRTETDLHSLTSDLIGVVPRTVHPARSSLWLLTETTRETR